MTNINTFIDEYGDLKENCNLGQNGLLSSQGYKYAKDEYDAADKAIQMIKARECALEHSSEP